jgi:hypothetical protein
MYLGGSKIPTFFCGNPIVEKAEIKCQIVLISLDQSG